MYYYLMTSISFPDWVVNELHKREMTPADLSRKGGISESALSKMLNGVRNPGIELLIGISKGLSMPRIEVFEAAGLLGDQVPQSKDITRLAHRINMLPDNQREVIITLINAILSQGGVHDQKEVESTQ